MKQWGASKQAHFYAGPGASKTGMLRMTIFNRDGGVAFTRKPFLSKINHHPKLRRVYE